MNKTTRLDTLFDDNAEPSPRERLPYGLVSWLSDTRIVLPLKGVESRFHIVGDVAEVEIDQIYYQSAGKALDCVYTFPLPAGAAVYRCDMHVNDRVIRAKVQPEEEARERYQQEKAAGRRVAMVEVERDNLFTLNLGNIQPEDVVVIRLGYAQVLPRLGAEMSLSIPVCPGVRYIPGRLLMRSNSGRGTADDTDQVPDASRISPPRIDSFHPDAAYFSAEGTVTRGVAEQGTMTSPTHPLVVQLGGVSDRLVLADNAAVPDRDFVVRWKEPQVNALSPHAWSCREGGETYALLQLRAPAAPPRAEGWSQDIYFLVDRSGSMSGSKWDQTCKALRAFVELLGVDDRVWITLFESDFRDFAEKPLPAGQLKHDPKFRGIHSKGVAGGTELLPALEHVLDAVKKHSQAQERRACLVLITDGEVGNEAQVLAALKPHPDLVLHTFGIDTTVNDAFLKSMARQQRGECVLRTPSDDIAAAVEQLGDRLGRPVLVDISVTGGGWEPALERIPNLLGGQVLDVPLRRLSAVDEDSRVVLRATLPGGEEQLFTYQLEPVETPACRLLWVRERIDTLLGRNANREAVELAVRHNVLCKGAAFIAWDDAEKVSIADSSIYQPSQSPEWAAAGMDSMMCVSMPAPSGLYDTADEAPQPMFSRGRGGFVAKLSKKSTQSLGLFRGEPLDETQEAVKSVPWPHRGRAEKWLRRMREFPLLQQEGVKVLLDIWIRWLLSDPKELKTRLAELEVLLEMLTKLKDRPDATPAKFAHVCKSFNGTRTGIEEMELHAAEKALALMAP